jgi:hypothetical protein
MNSNEWIRILALCLFVVAAARAEPASAAERPSLVQRLKLARESMLKGFNRKAAESGPAISVAVEDTSGTSDVVRQLTNDYSPEVVEEERRTQNDQINSKEGNLAASDASASGDGDGKIKPTKYHYYPHNQHLYLLPECATQQVCNAVYTRFNYSQPLCACADRFQGPCSASLARNDQHTIEVGYKKLAKAGIRTYKSPTLVKTCEETKQIRDCRAPQDWSLLALQNVRTGKSQYLVICRCDIGELDGPMSHDQPAYARVPGIRVFGMMCNMNASAPVPSNRKRRDVSSSGVDTPAFPWEKVKEFAASLTWD